MFGAKTDLDILCQAMGRAIRVNGGAITRDTLLKTDIEQLMRNLEVVARRSHQIPTERLEVILENVESLNRLLTRVRDEESI